MTHDEDEYDEPFEFKPERFFNESGNLNDDDRILAYGFGRRYVALTEMDAIHFILNFIPCRICVGKHVASTTVGGLTGLLGPLNYA